MKISVMGCGYLGAVHAAGMAYLGHDVVGVDVQHQRVEALNRGTAPFYEPGLDALLTQGLRQGKLRFTTDYADIIDADVHFICVGTPQMHDGEAADLSYLNSAITQLLAVLSRRKAENTNHPVTLIVGKSTVPVGTAARLAERVEHTVGSQAVLAWNPEFLREGFALEDTLQPDRLVYGLSAESDYARRQLDAVYRTLVDNNTPQVITDYATAELVKSAANAFLATKISFINAMAEICDAAGADVSTLAEALGHDERIGKKFLRAGVGFGGGCLPKDIRAFQASAEHLGTQESLHFLRVVDDINQRQRQRAVDKLISALGAPLAEQRIAVLGGAFKPDSDDIRDSPAVQISLNLCDQGAHVALFDPQAGPAIQNRYPQIHVVTDLDLALSGADVVAVLTEWQHFRDLEPERAAALMAGKIVLDGRNCLNADAWRRAGFTYVGMGRP